MAENTNKNFKLVHPFEFRGTQYNEVSMRRAKVRDLREFSKSLDKLDPIQAMEVAIGNLTDLDDTVIAELDLEDFAPIKAHFEGFLDAMKSKSDQS